MNGFETAVETLVKTFSSSPWGALGFRETLQTKYQTGFFSCLRVCTEEGARLWQNNQSLKAHPARVQRTLITEVPASDCLQFAGGAIGSLGSAISP